MSSNAKYFLKNVLGDGFLESLVKTEIYKQGSKSVIYTDDMHLGMKLVPRVIMSLLIRELVPMAIGETKEINIPCDRPTILKTTKHERDDFSGEVIQDNKKIYEFLHRPLPGVGLILLSSLELYNLEDLEKEPEHNEDIDQKIQKLIDDRLALHHLIDQVVDKKIMEKDAIEKLALSRLEEEMAKEHKKHEQISELKLINEKTTPQSDPYFQGMTNGLEVANAIVNEKEPNFIEASKEKGSPKLNSFLANRKKKLQKKEFFVEMTKSEVNCPDCKHTIFNSSGLYSGCVCMGENQNSKVYLSKSESGALKVKFGRGWSVDNIEMLLDCLRKNNG